MEKNELRLNSLVRLFQLQNKSLPEVLDFGLEEAIRLTDSRIGYIYFYDETARSFTLYSWSSSVMSQCSIAQKFTTYHLEDTGLWGEAVRQRRPIVTNDYAAENPWKKGCPAGHVRLCRHMNLPVLIEDRIVAVIGVGNKETDYTEEDVKQLELFMQGLWNIAERLRIEEELKKSEEKFRTVADFTHDWEYWVAPNREILYCSPSCLAITGHAPEEFTANPKLIRSIIHPEDLTLYESHIQNLHDIAKSDDCEFEFRIITRSRQIKWIGHVCRQVFASDGKFLGRRVSNRDITERKTGEQKLRDSYQEIRRLDGNLLNMIKLLSHDIRSPLLTMAATLKLLQRGHYGPIDASVANTLNDLSVRVKQILGIADDFIGKAQAVDANIRMEKCKIDLRQEVIEQVLEELTNEIITNDIRIDNRLGSIPTGAVIVNASRVWLQAVFRNLFRNAIKYGGAGAVLAYGYEDKGDSYLFCVFNTGTPIPVEKQSLLFKPFGRVDETGCGGVGMGLYLTKEIINNHGGDIWYEAVPGGSSFCFTLPKD